MMDRRRMLAEALLSPAAAPVARREFPLAPEPYVAPGQASMGNATQHFAPLDTVDPTALLAQRLGVGQTVPETARMWGQATAAAGFAGTTPMRGRATGFTTIDDDYGGSLRILQNPSQQQLNGFMARTQYKAARRLVDPSTGDVYVWDAGNPALHDFVARRLGIEYKPTGKGDVLFLE
jgi:hypothetical protein